MKKNFIFLFVFSIITFIHTSLKAQDGDVTVGLDIGYGFLDIGADETAQTIANLSGSTVTYSSDVGSWMGRVYGDLEERDGSGETEKKGAFTADQELFTPRGRPDTT